MNILLTTLLSLSLILSPLLAQEYQQPPKEGGGTKVGPAILIPFLLIPLLIKKIFEQKEKPTYPVLDKKPISISQSGNTYTVDWVIYYANNTNNTQNGVTVQDGPIQYIVPGSLQGPQGWTSTLNPINTIATWTGNAPPINGYMSTTISTSAASFNLGAATGDGFIPIPYRDSSGVLRIYYINHHVARSQLSTVTPFGCIDTSTGNPCSGFPKKLFKGDGSGKPSTTNMHPEEYFLKGDRLYYVVTAPDNPANVNNTSWEFGLGCYDLAMNTECGFFKLGTLPSGYNGEAYLKGPWKVGNELYIIDMDGKLYCLDANNPSNFCPTLSSYFTGFQLPSGSFPKPGVASWWGEPWWGPAVAGEIYNNKLYLTTSTHPLGPNMTLKTFCFDTTTKSTCAGWSVFPRTMPAKRFIGTFLYYDNTMTPKHVCARLNGFTQSCVNINSGVITTPPTIIPTLSSSYGLGSEITIGTRTYFPDFFMGTNAVHCWDWSAGASCAPTSFYPAWTTNPWNYAVNVDDMECIWVLGDNATAIWNFDPNKPLTGGTASRCEGKEGKKDLTFKPWEYCSGPKPFLWTQVEIANTSLSYFSKLIIRIKDNAGNVILTHDCIATSTLTANLATIASQVNGQPLHVEVDYALASGSNLQSFEVRAHYHASPLEFCFKSVHECSQDNVKNTVSVPGIQDKPVEISLTKPENCPVMAEDGQPSGGSTEQPTGGTSGQPNTGSGGVPPWLGGAVLTPAPLPGDTSSGSSTGATGDGFQVIEKGGQVQIVPEVKQRCYWRPKTTATTTHSVQSKPTIKKNSSMSPAKKPKEGASKTVQPQKTTQKVVKKSITKQKTQKLASPEMEYICEPEK